MRYFQAQNNFGSGFLGREADSRTEIEQFKNGLEEMTNFHSKRTGGAQTRPGFRLYQKITIPVKHASGEAPGLRAIPYVYKGVEYLLVIISGQINASPFYVATLDAYIKNKIQNGVSITDTTVFKNVTSLNADILYEFPQPHSKFNAFPTAVQPSVDTWNIFISGGEAIITNSSSDIEPLALVFYPTTAVPAGEWKITEFINTRLLSTKTPKIHYKAYLLGYPYVKNRDSTLTIKNKAAPTVVGADTVHTLEANADDLFTIDSIGTFIRILPAGTSTELGFYITGFTPRAGAVPPYVTAVKMRGQTATWVETTQASSIFFISGWNKTAGYPKLVNTFQQRLIFATTKGNPSTIWLSRTGDPFILTVNKLTQDAASTTDLSQLGYFAALSNDDAFSIGISSSEIQEIEWLVSQTVLLVGTSVGEHLIRGTGDSAFGALNREVVFNSKHGGARYKAIVQDRNILFVGNDEIELKQLSFSGEAQGYITKAISLLSQEYVTDAIKNPITDITSRERVFIKKIDILSEDSFVPILLSNGELIGAILDEAYGVASWCKYVTTAKNIMDIFVYLNPMINKRELWVVDKYSDTQYHVLIRGKNTDSYDIKPIIGELWEHPSELRQLDFVLIDRAAQTTATNFGWTISTANWDAVNNAFNWANTPNFPPIVPLQRVQLSTSAPWGAYPTGTQFWAIYYSKTQVRFATSLANAIAGTWVTLPAPGSIGWLLSKGINAIQNRFGLPSSFGQTTVFGVKDYLSGYYEEVGNFDWTNGAIILPDYYEQLNYGYSYKCRLKTLNLEPPATGAFGNLQMVFKRFDKLLFKLYKSYRGKAGNTFENLYSMEVPVPDPTILKMYTGDVVMNFDSSAGEKQQVCIEVDSGIPFGITGLFVRADTGEL